MMTPKMLHDLVCRGAATHDMVMWWLSYVELNRLYFADEWDLFGPASYELDVELVKPEQSVQEGGSQYA